MLDWAEGFVLDWATDGVVLDWANDSVVLDCVNNSIVPDTTPTRAAAANALAISVCPSLGKRSYLMIAINAAPQAGIATV